MIGLCIRYFNPNYGGMLQGYATMKLLEKRKLEFELIRYEKKKDVDFFISAVPRLFNPIFRYEKKLLLSKKINAKFHPEFSKYEAIRRKKFRKFEEDYFKPKERKYYGYSDLSGAANKYNAFITGSDQIWSPSGLETNFYNLMFVPDQIRKISLASSFGVSEIPKNQKERTKIYLNRIPFISMRENRGAEIVNSLTGRNVPVILDPVCMLSLEEWKEFASSRKFCKEKYLFAYLLGANPEYRKIISDYAKKNDLKIVTLRHANQYVKADEKFGDYWFYDVDPCDFLALIDNAEKVCTDSYHGSVFSLILHKELAIFSRYNDKDSFSKNSRIDTLCENYGIKERKFTQNTTLDAIFAKEMHYKKIDSVLNEGRQQFNNFLDNALVAQY